MECIALHNRSVSESLNAVTKAVISLRQGQRLRLRRSKSNERNGSSF